MNEVQSCIHYLIAIIIQMKLKQLRKVLTQYNQGLHMRGSAGQTGTQTGTAAHEHDNRCLQGKGRCLEDALLSQLCQPLGVQCLPSENVRCRLL